MSLQSVAHPDIAQVHSMLSKMDGPQLQQFAAAHQDNAIYVGLAMQVDKDRKAESQRLQALMSGKEQPNVMQQTIAALNPQGMAPPGMGQQGQGGAPMPPAGGPQAPMPPQGMPPAPPPGMQMPPAAPPPSGPGAASPGIAGLPAQNIQNMADGGIAGYADDEEPVVRMAGGTPPSMFRDPGYDPWKRPPTIAQLYGDTVDPEATSTFGELVKGAGQSIGRGLTGIGRGLQGAVQFIQDVGNPLKNPRVLEANRLTQAAQVTPGMFEALTPAERTRREAEAANLSSTFPLSDYSNEGYGRTPSGVAALPAAAAATIATQKAVQPATRSSGATKTGAPVATATPASSAIPTYTDKPVSSYIPMGKDVSMTAEEAQAAASPFSLVGTYAEGAGALLQSSKARDARLRALQQTAPNEEVGKKAEEYIKGQREELEAEKKDRGAHFLISAGLAIASGTSRNAMQNIAQGLQVGVKDAQSAMKDFKAAQKELARMESDLENARAAQKERRYDRMFAFEQSAADREERRQEHMFNGLMTVTGHDQQTALSMLNASQQRANDWSILGANMGYGRDERLSGQAFKASERKASEQFASAEAVKDRANRLAAASIDKEGDRIRQLGGGDLLAGYKALAEINKDKFSLPTAYTSYMTHWKPDPMNPAARMLNGAEFAAQMGSLFTTDKPPADATILRRPQ
jgi:hypothetical protein